MFSFFLENSTTKQRKQLVFFDRQNVNSLCSGHHYFFACAIIMSVTCASRVSIKLLKHNFKPTSVHIFFWAISET